MSGRIFHVADDGTLQKMEASSFPNEADLQTLLENHPDLIDGEGVDPDRPRRWLLVDREVPIAEDDASPGRWSLDHLMLDQDGVPTLIEVKRSSDTRVRREVLGQMLDYVAHAVLTWKAPELRRLFETRCARHALDPGEVLLTFLGIEDVGEESADAIESFWSKVATNLDTRRLRLLFVCDELPRELRRSIEFLNEHMSKIEVLGVELRHYTDGGSRVLVPHVVGQTERARSRRPASTDGPGWSEDVLLETLERRFGPAERDVARRIIALTLDTATYHFWSPSLTGNGGVMPVYKVGKRKHYPYQLWASGIVEFRFTYERKLPPFSDEALRTDWLNRLSEMSGFERKGGIDGLPAIRLEHLTNEPAWVAFEQSLRWWEHTIGSVARD